jgi:hypothetical protein
MRHYLLTIALLVTVVPAAAQSSAPLPPLDAATRVRVWSDGSDDALKGRVRAVTPLTLELSTGDTNPRVFQVSELERVDVSRGRNRWLWTGGGMLVGATAGVVLSRATNDDDSGPTDSLAETAEGVANTITGILVGGVVGFFVAPERWRNVWQK